MTSKDIIDQLIKRFLKKKAKYVIPNVYIYQEGWESDLFVLLPSGLSIEVEVKISRSDFFADQKKERKHLILENCTVQGPINKFKDTVDEVNGVKHYRSPNRFYYAAPKGLIKIEEVPNYAGLIEMTDTYGLEVKKAPILHHNKYDFIPSLCDKFFWKWLNLHNKTKKDKRELEVLRKIIAN